MQLIHYVDVEKLSQRISEPGARNKQAELTSNGLVSGSFIGSVANSTGLSAQSFVRRQSALPPSLKQRTQQHEKQVFA